MSRRARTLIVAVAVTALSVASFGCGSDVIDSEEVAAFLQNDIQDSLDVSVRAVSCPGDVLVEPRSRFVCRVDSSGVGEIDAVVEVLNSDADIRLAALRRHGE